MFPGPPCTAGARRAPGLRRAALPRRGRALDVPAGAAQPRRPRAGLSRLSPSAAGRAHPALTEHGPDRAGPVGDDRVHTRAPAELDVLRGVDGPDVHLAAPTV